MAHFSQLCLAAAVFITCFGALLAGGDHRHGGDRDGKRHHKCRDLCRVTDENGLELFREGCLLDASCDISEATREKGNCPGNGRVYMSFCDKKRPHLIKDACYVNDPTARVTISSARSKCPNTCTRRFIIRPETGGTSVTVGYCEGDSDEPRDRREDDDRVDSNDENYRRCYPYDWADRTPQISPLIRSAACIRDQASWCRRDWYCNREPEKTTCCRSCAGYVAP